MRNSVEVFRKTKNKNTILPYDLAIPFLGIYLERKNKTLLWKDKCTPISTALFAVTKIWKQPKCPSTNDQIKMRHIYTRQYYPATKILKKILLSVAMWMDLENIMVSEICQRKPNTIW